MIDFYPEGWLIDTIGNRLSMQNPATLAQASHDEKILEARALVCDGEHNLVVDLGCMKGIISREDGAIGIKEGLVRDIAVISRVNRPVCFTITGFKKDQNGHTYATLSRKDAQIKCMNQYIKGCKIGDVINARVTHLEPFGAFVDIGCGIVSLLPIDTISISRIEHPRERFSVGMDIKAVIKSIENDRISLTHKEFLGTWEENIESFSIGETVAGIVRSIEEYGAFIELAPNLAGLAEPKEEIRPGQQASVYIKNIIPSRMKIKLIIIDTFDYDYKPTQPNYFFDGNHIDKFVYSPKSSDRVIETVFNEAEEADKVEDEEPERELSYT